MATGPTLEGVFKKGPISQCVTLLRIIFLAADTLLVPVKEINVIVGQLEKSFDGSVTDAEYAF